LPFVTFPLVHPPPTFPTPHLSVGGAKMKLTFKDLKQQKFTIDAEPSETVSFDFFSQLS
jgi:hypothetical protein